MDGNSNINSTVYKVDINSKFLSNVHICSIAFRWLMEMHYKNRSCCKLKMKLLKMYFYRGII